MTDYIEREDAIRATCENCSEKDICGGNCDDTDRIQSIPAADVRPVVRGRWREMPRGHYFKCFWCNTPIPYRFGYAGSDRFYNFCPNCGAEMKEENDD